MEADLKVDTEEIELSLGLSIGGSFRKFEKPKQITQKSFSSSITFETDLRRENENKPESYLCRCSSRADAIDPTQQMKREIHALRRQEARKKREEKRKWRNSCNLRNDGEGSEKYCKKIRSDDGNQTLNLNCVPSFTSPPPPFPVIPMQYVPFANRFALPHYMMRIGDYKNKFEPKPITCRSVLGADSNWPKLSRCDSENNGVKQVQLQSSRSTGSGYSTVSDYYNGGSSSSSETRSHSSNFTSLQPQPHLVISNQHGKSEHTDSSHQTESTKGVEEDISDTGKVDVSSNNHCSPIQADVEEPTSVTNPISIDRTIPIPENLFHQPSPTQPRASTVDSNKSLPKQQQPQPSQTQFLTQMPCVSATGDGPKGKTITGFLYRCSKAEVSIMCVCHGSSFTPAEFVQHAGGTDVSHPLKHILVVPSGF